MTEFLGVNCPFKQRACIFLIPVYVKAGNLPVSERCSVLDDFRFSLRSACMGKQTQSLLCVLLRFMGLWTSGDRMNNRFAFVFSTDPASVRRTSESLIKVRPDGSSLIWPSAVRAPAGSPALIDPGQGRSCGWPVKSHGLVFIVYFPLPFPLTVQHILLDSPAFNDSRGIFL